MGSGTTAMVAKQLGRDYIGCELHEEYSNLIDQRVPVEEVAQVSTNLYKTCYINSGKQTDQCKTFKVARYRK